MSITENYNRCKDTPSDINEHIPTLKEYASMCEHITEMGVRSVVSTWAFLEANPKKLISIDINPCPIDDAARLAKQAGIDFTFIKGDTSNPDFVIEETDLLFIDTWHVYPQLKKEFELHSSKAKKFIILHDTTTFGERGEGITKFNIETGQVEYTPYPGLWPAVEEFLIDNSEWSLKERYTNNNGLTILQRNDTI